jgi:hypothetical protein
MVSGTGEIRWGWLKGMYIYTLVLAGGLGVGMLVMPEAVASAMGVPYGDPIIFGVTGSVYVAFGVLSVFGLRAPLRFAPVLLLQLVYKSVWFAGVALPLAVRGQFPRYGLSFVVILASYMIGDVIAIPFSRLFGSVEGERSN